MTKDANAASRRFGQLGSTDLICGAGSFLLLVGYLPDLSLGTASIRLAIAWVLGGLGLGRLLLLALPPIADPAARWALGFLAWAGFSVGVSGQPGQALMGDFGLSSGWIYLAAVLGCWALGRAAGSSTSRIVLAVLACGLTLNGALGLVQASAGEGKSGLLALVDGRATGMLENPVFFGALMAGGTVLTAWAASSPRWRRWWLWLLPLAAAAGVVNLAGSRIALLVGAALSLLLAVQRGPKRAAVVGVAFGVGLVLSSLLVAESGASRAAQSPGGGLAPRRTMWVAGVHAVVDRPVFGNGPNRFRQATTDGVDADFVLAEGPDTLFFDAHNLPLEIAVTTGLGGLVLLGGFGWYATRGASGPLAWFAAAVAVTWLLEPTTAGTAPIVLMALGLATDRKPRRREPTDSPDGGRSPRVRVVCLGVGLSLAAVGSVLGARLILADYHLGRAIEQDSLSELQAAQDLWPRDPVLANQYAGFLSRRASSEPGAQTESAAVRAYDRVVDLDPTQPRWWAEAGVAHLVLGPGSDDQRRDAARPYFDRALELNDWSLLAMLGLYKLESGAGNAEAAARWSSRLCEIDRCPE